MTINYWYHTDDIVAKEIDKSLVKQNIIKLKELFNDPLGSVEKAKDALTFIWAGITPTEEVRLDLPVWKELMKALFEADIATGEIIKPCLKRKEKKIEYKCCGGQHKTKYIYFCPVKNQPVTALGCGKCKL
jgi:hypothetical protein